MTKQGLFVLWKLSEKHDLSISDLCNEHEDERNSRINYQNLKSLMLNTLALLQVPRIMDISNRPRMITLSNRVELMILGPF